MIGKRGRESFSTEDSEWAESQSLTDELGLLEMSRARFSVSRDSFLHEKTRVPFSVPFSRFDDGKKGARVFYDTRSPDARFEVRRIARLLDAITAVY
jgi:hypothetical protein